MKKVCGVGVADIRKKDNLVVYKIWQNMLNRCYNQKVQEKKPTYIGCSVAEEWHRLSNFNAWFLYSNYKPGLQLDKDITNKLNKVYGPDSCSFVSSRVNKLITDAVAARGKWPVGVSFNKPADKFKAKISISGKLKHLGYFSTQEAAFSAYKIAKEAEIKRVATEELAAGNITKAVYEALMKWEIVS